MHKEVPTIQAVGIRLDYIETWPYDAVLADRIVQGAWFNNLGLPYGCRNELRRQIRALGGMTTPRYLPGDRFALHRDFGAGWEIYRAAIDSDDHEVTPEDLI